MPDSIRAWALDWDHNDGKPTYSVVEPEPPPSLGNRLIVDDLTRGQAALIVKNYNQALGRAADLSDGLCEALAEKTEEIRKQNKSLEMSCTEPADDCTCSGCVYAAEVNATNNQGAPE